MPAHLLLMFGVLPLWLAAGFAAMAVVGQAGANVFKEFAPELKRLIPRRKPRPTSAPAER